MTNILIDELPYSVEVCGQLIPINTDYRTGILFEKLMVDASMTDEQKLVEIMLLYFGEGIMDLVTSCGADAVGAAINAVRWFYSCGRETEPVKDTGEGDSDGKEEGSGIDPPFSYEYDAGYIYAAFIEAYHIDLTEKRLHWWQFRALFLALPDTTQFQKIVGYRVMKIPAKLPKDQKQFYQKMKRLYKIPEPPDRVQLEKDLEAILERGGDISQFIK